MSLSPNSKNIAAEIDSNPYSVGQVFDLRKYPGLRGSTLHVSANLGATKPAGARVRLIAIRHGGVIASILEQDDSAGKLVEHSGSLKIPDDNKTIIVVLGLDAIGTAGTAFFDDVYLGTKPRQTAAAPVATRPFEGKATVSIDASRVVRQIPDTLYGMNIEWGWDGNGRCPRGGK